MKGRAELVILTVLILGLFITILGLTLYIMRLLSTYNIGWELQLATVGLFILIFTLTLSKILSNL